MPRQRQGQIGLADTAACIVATIARPVLGRNAGNAEKEDRHGAVTGARDKIDHVGGDVRLPVICPRKEPDTCRSSLATAGKAHR